MSSFLRSLLLLSCLLSLAPQVHADLEGLKTQIGTGTLPSDVYMFTVSGSNPIYRNVGNFSGARSFEFVYNAAGAGPSKSILGSRNPVAGGQVLKINQWQNSGKYGLSTLGVADEIFDFNTIPNQQVHLVFTSDGSVTKLYVNGVFRGSIPRGLTITGINALGAFEDTNISAFNDNLDGWVLAFASYGTELSATEINTHASALFAATPTVTSITPATGTTLGGTSVTITGTGFTGVTELRINGYNVSSFNVVNSTTITGVTPSAFPGAGGVRVTAFGGISSPGSLFTFVTPLPVVSAILPNIGSTLGGTSVTITGANFTGASGVTIGGTPATIVSVNGSTSITCLTPAGTVGPKSVVVTTPGGTNAANTLFTYGLSPTVTSVLPSFGSAAGGTQVTITGTGFTGATGVTIGGTAAAGISVLNATTITCTAQARNAGPSSVQVITPFGTNVANTLYSYKAVTATNLSPPVGSVPYGQAFPFTVTVSATNPHQTPTGSVSLKEGATIVASTPRATPGTWTFSPVLLNAGAHTVTAQYDGDAWNLLSNSVGSVTFTVTKATGALALTSTAATTLVGDGVTFTATLAPATGGSVTFMDGATTLGTGTLSAGAASYTTSSLTVGTHAITAVFSGDANVNAVTSAVLTQTVNKISATVTLKNLLASYDGTAKTAGADTLPANLPVSFTYNGSSTAPTAVGSYPLVATVNSPTYSGTASGTFVIQKGAATVTISGQNHFYTGSPKEVTVTTLPPGLPYTLTYNGSTTPPSAVGSYPIVVTINSPNYAGSATDTMVISAAAATNLSLTSSGNPSVFLTQPTFTATVSATSGTPSGAMDLLIDGVLWETKQVNGSGVATFTPTAEALRGGSRTIRANYNANGAIIAYAPSNRTLTQVVNKAPLTVTLGALTQEYNGAARPVTATVTPPATHPTVQVDITYDGSSIAPINAGSYAVVATINDPSLQGTASGVLKIEKAPAEISFGPLAYGYDGTPHPVEISANPDITFSITYQPMLNGAPTGMPVPTPPSTVGNYLVALVPLNPNFEAIPASSTLTITKGALAVSFENLSVVADGTEKPVQVTTTPPGINVNVTYTLGGNTTAFAPKDLGSYALNVVVADPNYEAGPIQNVFLVIRPKQNPGLTMKGPESVFAGSPARYTATVPLGPTGFRPPGLVSFMNGTIDGPVLLGTLRPGSDGTCTWSETFPASPVPYSITAVYEGDSEYFAQTTGPVTTMVNKRNLELKTVGSLIHVYDTSPKGIEFTTDVSAFEHVRINVTYNNMLEQPVNASAGNIVVKADISPDDPKYTGSATVSMRINKAPATITLRGDLIQAYSRGATYRVSATTVPAGIPFELTYRASTGHVYNGDDFPLPDDIANYTVTAKITSSDYAGPDATGTLEIVSPKVKYTIIGSTLGDVFFDYDGMPKGISVTAKPSIRYKVTYNGIEEKPVAAGIYEVLVSSDQPGFTDKARARLIILGKMTVTSTDGLESGVGGFSLNNEAVPGATVVAPSGLNVLKFVGSSQGSDERWIFSNWADGSRENPRSIHVGGAGPSEFAYQAISRYERFIRPSIAAPVGYVSVASVSRGAWAVPGEVVRCTATPGFRELFEHWTQGGQIISSETELYLTVQRGAPQPVAHFKQGYYVQVTGGTFLPSELVASQQPPLSSGGVEQKFSKITVTATPKAGYKFTHWTATGGEFTGADPKTSKLLTTEVKPTASRVEVTANFDLLKVFFDVRWQSLKRATRMVIGSPSRFVPTDVVRATFSVRNAGNIDAFNTKITNVVARGFKLDKKGGGTEKYYPVPDSPSEVGENSKVTLSAVLKGKLNGYLPTADFMTANPANRVYLVGEVKASDYFLTDNFIFNWPQNWSFPSEWTQNPAEKRTVELLIRYTVEADGHSHTKETYLEIPD